MQLSHSSIAFLRLAQLPRCNSPISKLTGRNSRSLAARYDRRRKLVDLRRDNGEGSPRYFSTLADLVQPGNHFPHFWRRFLTSWKG